METVDACSVSAREWIVYNTISGSIKYCKNHNEACQEAEYIARYGQEVAEVFRLNSICKPVKSFEWVDVR